MPYDYIEEYQKQNDSMIYKFLAGALKENNDILPEIEDKQPYLYRATSKPEGAIEYVQEKLIGASAAVNQQLQPECKATATSTISAGGYCLTSRSTLTYDSSTRTNALTELQNTGTSGLYFNRPDRGAPLVDDHKYYQVAYVKAAKAFNIAIGTNTNIKNINNLAANTFNKVEYIAPFNNGSIEFKFNFNLNNNWTSSDIVYIKNIMLIDLTQMFGTSIADIAYTKEQTSAGSGIAWLKSYGFFTKDYYPYNTGALQSVKTGSKKVVGKNFINPNDVTVDTNTTTVELDITPNINYTFSVDETQSGLYAQYYNGSDWTSFTTAYGSKILKFNSGEYSHIRLRTYKSGTQVNPTTHQLELGSTATSYKSYTSTTYPLDSNLELRGLYKLDASNNIVCDGDEYTPDGSVKRRYGIVDLGTENLNWQYNATNLRFYAAFNKAKAPDTTAIVANILCSSKYEVISWTIYNPAEGPDKCCAVAYISGTVYIGIRDLTYTDTTAFKASLNGIYLIYELATPTTDSASSYQNPQIIHENGTEEFIDTRDYPLPVGHDTGYFTASDEKFFLPPVVDNDGRFLYHDGDGFQFKNFNQVASKVEESDINGNIKIDSVETQVYDDSELQGIVDTDTTVATGNPLNFSTKSAQNAVNTDIVIDPVQDLHGYSKPWVGGAGKNLAGITNTTYSTSGVSITPEYDSDGNFIDLKIVADGTKATETFYWVTDHDPGVWAPFLNKTLKAYTWGMTTGLQFELCYKVNSSDILAYGCRYANTDADGTQTITFGSSYYTLGYRVRVAANAVVNTTLKMMIVESSATATSFEPYTNICPISPKEQITVQGCGKNLIPYQELGRINQTSGEEETDNSIMRSGFISIEPNATYFFSGLHSGPLRFFVYDLNKRYIGTRLINTADESFTTNANEYYLRFQAGISVCPVNTQLQIEKGSTATSYEPYNLNIDLQIPLPNDFYGGTLNLETGELRVEKGIIDLGSLGWDYQSSSTRFRSGLVTNMKTEKMYTSDKIRCSILEPDEAPISSTYDKNGTIATWSDQRIYAQLFSYTDATEFKTAITGQKLTYLIANPYTIHLTPQQLNLLKATNNISTDAKTISVTYRNGELSTYAPATDIADGLLTATDKRAIDRTSVIVEGNPIQFSTESKQIARSTIIDLEPIQDLHGYSKPWVGGAGKNLLPLVLSDIKALNTGGTWSENVYSNSGITFTIDTDNDGNIIDIKVNGTASSNVFFYLFGNQGTKPLANGTYILNGCPSGGGTSYNIAGTGFGGAYDTGSGNTFTIDNNSAQTNVGINALSVSNKIFYPMIRLSTVSDATFEPYTNICSISGYDDVDINGCGENLLPLTVEDIKRVNSSSGSWSGNVYTLSNTVFTLLTKENSNIVTGIKASGTSSVNIFFNISDRKFDIDSLVQSYSTKTVNNYSLSTGLENEGSASTYYAGYDYTTFKTFIKIVANYNPNNMVFKPIMSYNDPNPIFEPYTESNNISIQLGNTVYGGKLDVEKGELVVDREYAQIDSVNGVYNSTNNRYITSLTNISKPDAVEKYNEVNCVNDKFESISLGRAVTSGVVGVYANASNMGISGFKTSLADYKSWLTDNPVTVCYELATPFTIKLTPHQINLLRGVNTITTNANSITLQYRNGEVATLEDLKILSDNLIAHTEDTEPYGFIEHMSILDPAQRIEYIGKNKNYSPMTINLAGDHLANYNEWYDFPVIKENKPYMIKADGTVDYALDPNDYTKKFDGSASDVANTSYTGGAFAWIPKTYKREFTVGDDRYVYISTKKLSDEYEAIGFIDENGLEHDGAWIPMFYGTEITQDGTVKIMTLATGAPTQNRNTDTQKTYLTNANPDTLFFGGPIVKVLTDIMIMLGKNSDVQAVFGTGNMSGGNGAQYMKDNACIDGGAFYGTTTNNVLNKAFHSLVLLTQNQWQRDPYTLNIQGEYVVSPYYKYDLTGDSYVKTGVFVTPPSSNNWVYPHKSVSVPHWGSEPEGPYSGSTTTGWADGQYTLANQLTDTTVRVVRRFANCNSGRSGGLRAVSLADAASYTYWHVGASPLLLSKGTAPQ